MPLPRSEIESVSTCPYESETMTFSTSNPAHYRAMLKLGQKPGRVSVIDKEEVAWTFELPADWFRLPKPKKQVSDTQRARAREMGLKRWDEEED